LRREFVSIVQGIIDPQSFNRDVAKILAMASDARAKDPTLGGLLPDATSIPSGAAGIMEAASKRYQAAPADVRTKATSGIVMPGAGVMRAGQPAPLQAGVSHSARAAVVLRDSHPEGDNEGIPR
jgi:hypothetical protein